MLCHTAFLVLAKSELLKLANFVLHFEEEISSEVRISFYLNFSVSATDVSCCAVRMSVRFVLPPPGFENGEHWQKDVAPCRR